MNALTIARLIFTAIAYVCTVIIVGIVIGWRRGEVIGQHAAIALAVLVPIGIGLDALRDELRNMARQALKNQEAK